MSRKEASPGDDEFEPKIGPPRVTQLAEWGCTNEEIAEEFNITVEFLERQYAGQLRLGRLQRCLTVRRQMYRLVKKHANPPCTRFLYEYELPTAAEEQDAAEAEQDAELEAMSEEELEQEIQRLKEEEEADSALKDPSSEEGQGGAAAKES
jgi:uncharacterized membrane protein